MTGKDTGICHKKSPEHLGVSGHLSAHLMLCCWTSPIQTLTVGPGISPGQPIAAFCRLRRARGLGPPFLANHTAGREFHPAPKPQQFQYSIIGHFCQFQERGCRVVLPCIGGFRCDKVVSVSLPSQHTTGATPPEFSRYGQGGLTCPKAIS